MIMNGGNDKNFPIEPSLLIVLEIDDGGLNTGYKYVDYEMKNRMR